MAVGMQQIMPATCCETQSYLFICIKDVSQRSTLYLPYVCCNGRSLLLLRNKLCGLLN